MKRILVVDGDTGVRARIAKHARMEGYDVTEAGDGETALSLSRQQNAFDLMVLAVNLPGMDGFTVLKAVRTFSTIPVLILSSKNTAEDRIHGLELGADDYMTKPFSARELLLRISAILKRCSTLASEEAEVLRSGGLVLDLTARRVEVDGRQINLTPREFDLLTVLMSHPDVAFSRKRLLDIIWGGELSTDTRTLDTHIQHIRCAIVPYSDRIVIEEKSMLGIKKNKAYTLDESKMEIRCIPDSVKKEKKRKESKKNEEDIEKRKLPYYPNDSLLEDAFQEFLLMRKKIKRPLATKQALTRMMNKIQRLSGGDNELAVKIINQSTDHCWQDVYELKKDSPYPNKQDQGKTDWNTV